MTRQPSSPLDGIFQDQYQAIVESTDDAIICKDINGTILSWNRAAEQLYGYSRQEVVGQHISCIVPLDKQDELKDIFLKLQQNQKIDHLDTIRIDKHGNRVPVSLSISPIRNEKRVVVGAVTVAWMSTLKQKQDALARTVQELSNIRYALDQSSIVAITDRHGVIQYVNDKFVEISKYSREELIGKTHRVINSAYHPKEYIADLWQTILAGNVWRGELRNRAKDGTYYWVDTTITPLLGSDGQPQQFIAIRNDITKRKQLEQLKDEFIGIASHELKTPVTSLKAYTQVLERIELKEGDTEALEILRKMTKQVDTVTNLISELLDVTKIEAGSLPLTTVDFDLYTLVKETAEETQLTTTTHTITVEAPFDPIVVHGDKDRIAQVLVNYLSNAIKYSPSADTVVVSFKVADNHVIVSVQDFGMGIPQHELDSIFGKFYRSTTTDASVKGLGLGLYISAGIVVRHRGSVSVQSEVGKGSTFSFSLPLASS